VCKSLLALAIALTLRHSAYLGPLSREKRDTTETHEAAW